MQVFCFVFLSFFFSASATARMVKKLCKLFLLNRLLYRVGEGTE